MFHTRAGLICPADPQSQIPENQCDGAAIRTGAVYQSKNGPIVKLLVVGDPKGVRTLKLVS
jgi:hypothetical protein